MKSSTPHNDGSRFTRLHMIFTLALGAFMPLGVSALSGQVGRVTASVPGWVPSDGVEPVITTSATYDSAAGFWVYRYEFANAPGARQSVAKIGIIAQVDIRAVRSPAGWWAASYGPNSAIPGVTFGAIPSDDPAAAPPAAIKSARSVSGFEIRSSFPPGVVRVYVQGFTPPPSVNYEAADEASLLPHDTLNAQRRDIVGPVDYSDVRRLSWTSSQLHGLVRLPDQGMTFRRSAPIPIRFTRELDPVDRATFSAELNGADVTRMFSSGGTGGADLVAVLSLGDSPAKLGENVLVTTVRRHDALRGQTLDRRVSVFVLTR